MILFVHLTMRFSCCLIFMTSRILIGILVLTSWPMIDNFCFFTGISYVFYFMLLYVWLMLCSWSDDGTVLLSISFWVHEHCLIFQFWLFPRKYQVGVPNWTIEICTTFPLYTVLETRWGILFENNVCSDVASTFCENMSKTCHAVILVFHIFTKHDLYISTSPEHEEWPERKPQWYVGSIYKDALQRIAICTRKSPQVCRCVPFKLSRFSNFVSWNRNPIWDIDLSADKTVFCYNRFHCILKCNIRICTRDVDIVCDFSVICMIIGQYYLSKVSFLFLDVFLRTNL